MSSEATEVSTDDLLAELPADKEEALEIAMSVALGWDLRVIIATSDDQDQ